ncbi:MAG: 30S ribosomal protein S6e [Candidatus Micrarchaeaceae archaeon]
MKLVFSDKKSGKTAQVDIPKDREGMLIGKIMGEVVDGTAGGLEGFKLQITGLSDNAGSPSRPEIEGTRKASPLISNGPGMRHPKKGFRSRRVVRGNTISADTVQINTVITEYGAKPAAELFKPKEKKAE